MTCNACKANADLRRTRTVACALCPSHREGKCVASGWSVELHIKGAPCPRGKHPDAAGIVRWLGVRWYGVPYPVRLWQWSKDRDGRWFRIPSCGCLVWLKDWVSRLRRWVLV